LDRRFPHRTVILSLLMSTFHLPRYMMSTGRPPGRTGITG